MSMRNRLALAAVAIILLMVGAQMMNELNVQWSHNWSTVCKPSDDQQTVVLTEADIINIKKIVSTEVAHRLPRKARIAQVRGVVDTVLNRLASKHWGESVSKVGNAYGQFSAINSALSNDWGSLEAMPLSKINSFEASQVDIWLRLRAAGTESSVGNNLSYANPLFVSRRSKGWVMKVVQQAKKSGYIFGVGKARHYHGTSPDLVAFQPAPYLIQLPATERVL